MPLHSGVGECESNVEGETVKLPSLCRAPVGTVDLSQYSALQVERFIRHPRGYSCASSSIFSPLLEDPAFTKAS